MPFTTNDGNCMKRFYITYSMYSSSDKIMQSSSSSIQRFINLSRILTPISTSRAILSESRAQQTDLDIHLIAHSRQASAIERHVFIMYLQFIAWSLVITPFVECSERRIRAMPFPDDSTVGVSVEMWLGVELHCDFSVHCIR